MTPLGCFARWMIGFRSGSGAHLLQTADFETFEIAQLIGPAAKNMGMALFPRRVNGQYLALSRWDRESIAVASSPDAPIWGHAVTVQAPQQPWELIQLGNCGLTDRDPLRLACTDARRRSDA